MFSRHTPFVSLRSETTVFAQRVFFLTTNKNLFFRDQNRCFLHKFNKNRCTKKHCFVTTTAIVFHNKNTFGFANNLGGLFHKRPCFFCWSQKTKHGFYNKTHCVHSNHIRFAIKIIVFLRKPLCLVTTTLASKVY